MLIRAFLKMIFNKNLRINHAHYILQQNLIFRIALLPLILVLLLIAIPASPILAEDSMTPACYLDQTLTEMVSQGQITGAIAAVVDDTGVVLSQGYGLADVSANLPADSENTAFRIGSIAKTFVAIAALQQVDAGRIDLHASISTYLEEDFPPFQYDITMHQLLTHTAGFEDLVSGIAIWKASDADPLATSIRRYLPRQVFRPGQVVSYSNYGIALAAYIVERVSGQDFAAYARQNLFQPLGMDRTTFELDPAALGLTVSQAYQKNGQPGLEPLINLYPEGSAVSTAADMARYMSWLLRDDHQGSRIDGDDQQGSRIDGVDTQASLDSDDSQILSVESKAKLWDRQYGMTDDAPGIGYTWNRFELDGSTYVEKTGITAHFRSWVACFPEQKTGLFVVFNTPVDDRQLHTLYQMASAITLEINPLSADGNGDLSGLPTDSDTNPGDLDSAHDESPLLGKSLNGYYVATRSNFTGLEKLYTLLMPERNLTITSNQKTGYQMDGQLMVPVAPQSWKTPRGVLTRVVDNQQIFLASQTALSWVRASWLEHWLLQAALVSLFALLSLVLFFRETVGRLLRKPGAMPKSLHLPALILSILQLGLLTGLIAILYDGVMTVNLQSQTLPVLILASLLALIALVSLAIAFVKRSRSLRTQDKHGKWQRWPALAALTAHTLITLGFIAWLIQNHLITLRNLASLIRN